MTAIGIAFKIWIRTLLLNGLMASMALLFMPGNSIGFGIGFIIVAVGVIITSPLLLFITPLVNLHTDIPYSPAAKINWLTTMLLLLATMAYCSFSWIFNDAAFPRDKEFYWLLACTCCSIVIAVYWTKESLTKFNNKVNPPDIGLNGVHQ